MGSTRAFESTKQRPPSRWQSQPSSCWEPHLAGPPVLHKLCLHSLPGKTEIPILCSSPGICGRKFSQVLTPAPIPPLATHLPPTSHTPKYPPPPTLMLWKVWKSACNYPRSHCPAVRQLLDTFMLGRTCSPSVCQASSPSSPPLRSQPSTWSSKLRFPEHRILSEYLI